MNKLSIKRMSGKGAELNDKNYEILADGRKLDTTNLQSIDIDTYIGDAPAVTLRYEPKEIEIELDSSNNGEYMLCKKQVGEYAKKVLDEAKKELPKSATSNITEAKDKNEDYMTYVITQDNANWIAETVLKPYYEKKMYDDVEVYVNNDKSQIKITYVYNCFDKRLSHTYKGTYNFGETITVIDGVIQKGMNVIETFTDL